MSQNPSRIGFDDDTGGDDSGDDGGDFTDDPLGGDEGAVDTGADDGTADGADDDGGDFTDDPVGGDEGVVDTGGSASPRPGEFERGEVGTGSGGDDSGDGSGGGDEPDTGTTGSASPRPGEFERGEVGTGSGGDGSGDGSDGGDEPDTGTTGSASPRPGEFDRRDDLGPRPDDEPVGLPSDGADGTGDTDGVDPGASPSPRPGEFDRRDDLGPQPDDGPDGPGPQDDLGPMGDWRRDYAEQFERFGPEDVAFRQEERPGGTFPAPYIPESTVRETLREDAASQSEWIDPSDVEVTETEEGGFTTNVPQETVSEALREDVASQSEWIDPSDVEVTETEEGGFTTNVPQETLDQIQQERITERRSDLRQRAADQYDVSPDRVVLEQEGDQLVANVSTGPAGTGDVIDVDAQGDAIQPLEGAQPGETVGQTTRTGLEPGDLETQGIVEAATNVAQQTVDDPAGYVGGGTADFLTEDVEFDVDRSLQNEQVSVPGYERIRDPVQGAADWWDENVARATRTGAETATGSETVGQIYGGIARGVNPAGAVDAGLGVHEGAAYVTAGAFEGPGEVAQRTEAASERGFYVTGRGIESAQENPARAAGMVVGGALVGTAASAGARAGVSGARTAAGRLRRSDGPDPVGGTDIRSGAPDPWEGVDASRPLREQSRRAPRAGEQIEYQAGAGLQRTRPAPSSISRGRQRGGQRRGGTTTESVRQDALTQYQDYLEGTAARERAAARRDVDPDTDPIGADRPQAAYDPDAAQVPLRERPATDADAGAAGFRVRDPVAERAGMVAAAQRQEVLVGDTFDAQEEALGLAEGAAESEVSAEARQTASVQELARVDAAQQQSVTVQDAVDADASGTGVEATVDVGQTRDTDTGQRTGTAQRGQTGQATATTTTTTDTPPRRPPPITPFYPTDDPFRPPGTPTDQPSGGRTRVPLPDPDPSPAGSPSPDDTESVARDTGDVDRSLIPGWGAETVTVAADPGVRDVTPSQRALEREFVGVRGAQELPTQQLLDDDEAADADAFVQSFGAAEPSDGDGDVFDFWGEDDGDEDGWLP